MILLVIFWLLASCAFSLTRMPLEVEGKEYFVNLFTGSPPILSSKVKIDTGSSLTTLACSLCLNCRGNSSSFYDPYKSISARLAQCVLQYLCRRIGLMFARNNALHKAIKHVNFC